KNAQPLPRRLGTRPLRRTRRSHDAVLTLQRPQPLGLPLLNMPRKLASPQPFPALDARSSNAVPAVTTREEVTGC
ncbi:hypothetical protein PHISCL_10938, partial [Aspergillus sclerotialis]